MALVHRPLPAQAPKASSEGGTRLLEEAIQDFERVLLGHDLQKLHQSKAVPDAESVMQFTAELDAANRSRRGRSIASRLYAVLQSVRDFTTVVDTLVSSNPGIAALVWGSIKLTMQIVSNYTSYFEEVSNLFLAFKADCPRFDEYQAIFPTSRRLQDALCRFHASIIRCCKHAVEAINRPWQKHLLASFRQSFQKEFEPDQLDIKIHGEQAREEILLAKAQADHEFQQLERKEREIATKGRIAQLFQSKQNYKKLEMVQTRHDQLHQRIKRQQILDSVSIYDYRKAYKEACQKRYHDTTQWVFQTPEFVEWKDEVSSSVIWCAGKIGSGKTVLSASVIDFVARKKNEKERITYFFLRFDDAESLKTEMIFRSILRQVLDMATLSEETLVKLEAIGRSTSSTLSHYVEFLQHVLRTWETLYVILDGVDECEPSERRVLLHQLSSLLSGPLKIKIFLSSRESLSREFRMRFNGLKHVSMKSEGQESDIRVYVEQALHERQEYGEFFVEDELLLETIKSTLSKHANGMFLWVTYLIDEICAQYCDDDIYQALKNLPQDLKETFSRALGRIVSRKHSAVAKRIFPWVAAAKRPLSLDELCEAVSLQIGQTSSKPERWLTGKDRVISWCENLLELDEEYNTIQFAHQTIFDFITEPSATHDFKIDLQHSDLEIGQICITYFHFSDFQTTLARRTQQNAQLINPAAIAATTLDQSSKYLSGMAFHVLSRGLTRKNSNQFDISHLATYGRANGVQAFEALQKIHPFLKYASEHWISHSANFHSSMAPSWELWSRVVTTGHELATRPWTTWTRGEMKDQRLHWAISNNHFAMIQLFNTLNQISIHDRPCVIAFCARAGNKDVLDVLLEKKKYLNAPEVALEAAANAGHLQIVKHLVAAGASLKAGSRLTSRNALQGASLGGHIDVVAFLLQKGADMNAPGLGDKGRTALQAACEGGHLETVKYLLMTSYNTNRTGFLMIDFNIDYTDSRAGALRLASEHGHVEIMKELLLAGASTSVRDENHEWTALQEAAGGGHLEAVKLLLQYGADPKASAARKFGLTAMQAACRSGNMDVVNLLSFEGVGHNEPRAKRGGWSALEAACGGGNVEIVQYLYLKGARFNAWPSEVFSFVPLEAAARNGHLAVIDAIMHLDSSFNEIDSDSLDSLELASGGGHIDVVRRLLPIYASKSLSPREVKGIRPSLTAAASGGHLNIVDMLLAASAGVAAKDEEKLYGALEQACRAGQLHVVKRLLLETQDDTAQDLECFQRLACESGQLDVFQYLLRHNMKVNGPTHQTIYKRRIAARWTSVAERLTLLQAASYGGNIKIVQLLLDQGADVNADSNFTSGYTALQGACYKGNIDVVELLLASKAVIDDSPGCYGTSLLAACTRGHVAIVELLLKGESRLQAGMPEFVAAIQGGHLEIVEHLVDAGYSFSSLRNSHVSSAIKQSRRFGFLEVANLVTDILSR